MNTITMLLNEYEGYKRTIQQQKEEIKKLQEAKCDKLVIEIDEDRTRYGSYLHSLYSPYREKTNYKYKGENEIIKELINVNSSLQKELENQKRYRREDRHLRCYREHCYFRKEDR